MLSSASWVSCCSRILLANKSNKPLWVWIVYSGLGLSSPWFIWLCNAQALFSLLILMNVLLYSGRRVFSQNIKTLIRLAYEDPITGAKNTAHFDESFQQILETKQPFSTAALNVHNFKGINDLFGRMRGDRVLCYMENVLNHNLKEGEFFCRDTADLFYLLLLDTDEESIKKRLAVIIEQIRASSLEYG